MPTKEGKALKELENMINKPLPLTAPDHIKDNSFSFLIENNHVTHLALEYQELSSLPESIEVFTDLVFLNLNYNQLNSIPTSITDLSNFQDLELSRNKLSSLPSNFKNLMKLRNLDLSKNNFSSFPDIIRHYYL